MDANWEALATTPAAAVVAPARQGWLQQYRRAGGVVRGWKGVFCVLVGETLCEYADHDAAAPARLVALRGARVVLPNAATDSATNCSARQSTTTAGTMHAAASDPHTAPLWLSSIPVCRPDSEMRRCQCTKKGGKSVSQHLCPFFFR